MKIKELLLEIKKSVLDYRFFIYVLSFNLINTSLLNNITYFIIYNIIVIPAICFLINSIQKKDDSDLTYHNIVMDMSTRLNVVEQYIIELEKIRGNDSEHMRKVVKICNSILLDNAKPINEIEQ